MVAVKIINLYQATWQRFRQESQLCNRVYFSINKVGRWLGVSIALLFHMACYCNIYITFLLEKISSCGFQDVERSRFGNFLSC